MTHTERSNVGPSVPKPPPPNGSWIKVRTNLRDDPRIARLCELLQIDEVQAVGACVVLWSLADSQSVDGVLGYSAATVDRKVSIAGFAEALAEVGWLKIAETSVSIPRFDEHNGRSAKKRAQDAARAARHRQSKGVTSSASRNERDGCVTQSKSKKSDKTPQKGMGEWDSIQRRLTNVGITHAPNAVRHAKSIGWTVDHAAQVIRHFEKHPKAWGPSQLYERFRQSSETPPEDGWPRKSSDYDGLRRAQHLETQTRQERSRQAEQRAKIQLEREQGIVPSFSGHRKTSAERNVHSAT